ncbi:unnamed protein product [Closterium sp. Yama58-4]|nr:unnamed protein product [Closterium sp. Yama58-4]
MTVAEDITGKAENLSSTMVYSESTYNGTPWGGYNQYKSSQSRSAQLKQTARAVMDATRSAAREAWGRGAEGCSAVVDRAVGWARQGGTWRWIVLGTTATSLLSLALCTAVSLIVTVALTTAALIVCSASAIAAAALFLFLMLFGVTAVLCVAASAVAFTAMAVASAAITCILFAAGTALSACAWWWVLTHVTAALRSSAAATKSYILPAPHTATHTGACAHAQRIPLAAGAVASEKGVPRAAVEEENNDTSPPPAEAAAAAAAAEAAAAAAAAGALVEVPLGLQPM